MEQQKSILSGRNSNWEEFGPALNYITRKLKELNVIWKLNDKKDGYRIDVEIPNQRKNKIDFGDNCWIKCNSQETKNYIVALIQGFEAKQEEVYALRREKSAREKADRQATIRAKNHNYTDIEIRQLINKWLDDTWMHSFKHTMLQGEAFEELEIMPKERLLPIILDKMQKGNISMALQGFLQDLSGDDIGDWEEKGGGWRAYDVKSSAERWVAWGKEKGYIK